MIIFFFFSLTVCVNDGQGSNLSQQRVNRDRERQTDLDIFMESQTERDGQADGPTQSIRTDRDGWQRRRGITRKKKRERRYTDRD